MATSTESLLLDDSRQYVAVAYVGVLLSLAAFVFGLRFYTRLSLVRSVGVDDWVIFMALLAVIACGVAIGVMSSFGLGRHVQTLSQSMVENYLLGFYLSIVFYYTSLGLIKLGILLQYYPLVAVKARKLMKLVTAAISAWSVALLVVQIFSCKPISGFWRNDIDAVCLPSLPVWYINAAGNILTDVIIFALPLPIVWKLQMPRSQRMSLVAVFCLGFFTCAISVIRIDFLNLGEDFTYRNVAPAGWSLAELCAGIICACLPTLRPLFFRVATQATRRKSAVGEGVTRGSSVPLRKAMSFGSITYAMEDSRHPRDPLGTLDEETGSVDDLGASVTQPATSLASSSRSIRADSFRNVM